MADETLVGSRNVMLALGDGRLNLYDQPPARTARAAVHHLGVQVRDLDALVQRMTEAGMRLRKPIRAGEGFRYVMIEAPDSVLVEVFEGHDATMTPDERLAGLGLTAPVLPVPLERIPFGPMGDFNFADVFEAVAAAVPDRPAMVFGSRVVSWRDFDRRANALAADLLDAGLQRGSKVAAYLYNSPEYLETYYAATKVAMWPVNTNYRYAVGEITYLFDNADAEAVVFDTAFTETAAAARERLPAITRWYAVGQDPPPWAVPYGSVVDAGADRAPQLSWDRAPNDVVMTYTGGTTGMPKGVMWSHAELFKVMGHGGNAMLGIPPVESLAELAAAAKQRKDEDVPVVLEACPLMHATALGNAYGLLPLGSTIVLLDRPRFDPAHLWDEVDRNGVTWLTIVGDAFARPLLAELEANPGRWRLDRLTMIYSAGVMWSREVKAAMLEHLARRRDPARRVRIHRGGRHGSLGLDQGRGVGHRCVPGG